MLSCMYRVMSKYVEYLTRTVRYIGKLKVCASYTTIMFKAV